MGKRSTSVLSWLISLVNPPPLKSMSRLQKVVRILLFSMTLVLISILSSMLAAIGIFAVQHARHIFSGTRQVMQDILIIFVSMLVNTLCVMAVLKIKHADQILIPPAEPPTDSK